MNSFIDSWLRTIKCAKKPDEFEAKQLLQKYGIAVPKGVLVESVSTINLEGLKAPLVAKVCSPQVLHKTEESGVRLHCSEANIHGVAQELQDLFPQTPVLIEEQISFSSVEFIIGALVDPVFGPAIMAGAGGILTELYKDISFRLVPCSRNDAENMLDELMLAPLFQGYRGIQCDRAKLAETIVKVSTLVADLDDLFSQLDINPLVFSSGTWIALDAKLILSEDERG
jgi:succinyl-CoA synthetase beta subunit